MTSHQNTAGQGAFIPAFEGLRGLLALSIFVFHVVRFCGFHVPLISDGGLRVDVFIILSGFVIARLRLSRPEPYGVYLRARAARIYPAYLVALGLGVMMSGLISEIYAIIPWEQADQARMVARAGIEQTYFWPLFLSHLTLLHGIFPENILPTSPVAFVGPAWSLSLEWQFYLVAPLLIAALRSLRFCVVAGILMIGVMWCVPWIYAQADYGMGAFLPLKLGLFLTGIGTAFLFDVIRRAPVHLLIVGVLAVMGALMQLSGGWGKPVLPFAIWFAVVIVAAHPDVSWARLAALFLESRPVLFLGRVSYGLYIYHSSVYLAVAAGAFILGVRDPFIMLVILMGIALPMALGLSALSYTYLEKPVMNWAKRYRPASRTICSAT